MEMAITFSYLIIDNIANTLLLLLLVVVIFCGWEQHYTIHVDAL